MCFLLGAGWSSVPLEYPNTGLEPLWGGTLHLAALWFRCLLEQSLPITSEVQGCAGWSLDMLLLLLCI